MFINASFISQQSEGAILDLTQDVKLAPRTTRLLRAFEDHADQQPVMIAKLSPIPTKHDIAFSAFPVKAANSSLIAIPKGLEFTVGAAQAVAKDLLQLRGGEAFRASQISLMVGCQDVAPRGTLLPHFAGWHGHVQHGVDLAYAFSNKLPTEFKLQSGQIVQPVQNAVTRFGGAALHRSTKNETGESLRRIFGIFIVYPHEKKPVNGEPFNELLLSSKRGARLREFRENAHLIARNQSLAGFRPLNKRLSEQPVAVAFGS